VSTLFHSMLITLALVDSYYCLWIAKVFSLWYFHTCIWCNLIEFTPSVAPFHP
jgi:hypothetical protein